MASIVRTVSDGWCVRWDVGRDRKGRRIRDSRTFATEDEAIAFRLELDDLRGGTGKDGLTARGLQWVDDRLAIGRITDKTAVGYREKLRGWSALLGVKPYKKITTSDIERAYARLAAGQTPTGRKPSPRTLASYRQVLSTFMAAMEKKGEIRRNPVRGVEGPGGLATKTRRAPTIEELARMLEVAEQSSALWGQLPVILRLGAHLGLRRGEICALRWSDVDFKAMTVTIARAATQPHGKEVWFKSPKTESGIRCIAMLEPTAAILRAQKRRVAEWRLAAETWADNDLVVCSPFGEVLDLENVSRMAGDCRDRAGVPRKVLPLHGQRHYAISQMHTAGIDLLTMQQRAGHADLRSTQGYVTIDAQKDRDAAERVAKSLI
jgi:integrase